MDPIDSLHPPREHYRESCDNCAKSKVRCGKEQPWCQRCVRRGQVCSYSPSQRPRKRALSATAHSDPELKMRRTGTPPCFGGMGSGARSRSYTHTDKPDHAGMGAFGDPETWGPCPVFAELFGGPGTGAGSGSGSGASTNSLASNNNANFTWLSGIESLGGGGDGADVFMLPSGSGMGTPAIGDTDNSSNASCEDDLTARERDRQHCEVDVVAALAKLQGPLLSCRGDTKTTGNLGTILAASRSALSCAFKTVECTCKPNDNVALLVTTLLLRILTWYDIVLDNCQGPRSGSPEEELSHDHGIDDEHDELRRGSIWEERDAMENMQQEGNGGSHLFVPPMTIGAYELDAENRERIIGHVLLSELNKMGRLLTSFSQRFCDPQSLSLASGANDNNKSQLYMAVEMFIRNKHSATVLAARKKLEAK